MKIGIFGGTFNPVHIGHINASLEFYDRAGLSKMFVIPDRIPPHKQGEFASGRHRMNMLTLAYASISDKSIEISDVELMREGKSYTYHTLLHFKERFPDDELYLYVGSDMYYTLPSWYRAEELFSMCTFAVAPREAGEKEKILSFEKKYTEEYGAKTLYLDIAPLEISSTEIREDIAKKQPDFTKKLLTEEVRGYIMENNLYRE